MSTLEKVIYVIAQETGMPAESLSGDTSLQDLGLDSLEFVCLMKAIQQEVADIPDAQWAGIDTVGGIAEACEQIH